MVGENFVIKRSKMAKIAFKLSTMAGEYFEIFMSQMSKIAFKLFTMVGKPFEIYLSEVAQIWEILIVIIHFGKVNIKINKINFHSEDTEFPDFRQIFMNVKYFTYWCYTRFLKFLKCAKFQKN